MCVRVCVLCSGVVAHNKLLTNDSSVRALNSNEKRTKRRVRNSRKVENWKSGRKAAANFSNNLNGKRGERGEVKVKRLNSCRI